MTKVFVCRLLVSAGELVGERLRADAVVAGDKVRVGNGCTARLNGPHGLAQCPHRRRRIKHDFSAVHAECLMGQNGRKIIMDGAARIVSEVGVHRMLHLSREGLDGYFRD